MKRIIKGEEPEFWRSYRQKNKNANYDSLEETVEGKGIKTRLRDCLLSEQKRICCYCCRSIDESNARNEHIEPRSMYPQKSLDYDNILASCDSPNSCDVYKKNHYDAKMFVSPLKIDCEKHFKFRPDGKIIGVTEAGNATINCLNLNDTSLMSARRTLYKECQLMSKCMGSEYVFSEYIQETEGSLPRFVDMVSYFYNRGDFDADVME